MTPGETTQATGPYRITSEVAEFTGDAVGDDGLPKPGATPTLITVRYLWFEADGTEVTDRARLYDLEATLAADQGDAYVPWPGLARED